MAVDYGSDWSWGVDADPTGALCSGYVLLGQAAYHRITTPRGSNLDAPDAGIDITEFLHKGMTETERAEVPNLIRQEILDDPRFSGVETTMAEQWTTEGITWTISIRVTPTDSGPFDLVCSVEQAVTKIVSITPVAA